MGLEKEKNNAALAAIDFVEDNMVIGLGSGSTASYLVEHLAELVHKDGYDIVCVSSSEKTTRQALDLGLTVKEVGEVDSIDLNIDGADEFDPYFQLIKGGGGALLREKIIAHNASKNIVIVDSSKQVFRLGVFPLPIEVIPFASKAIFSEFSAMGLLPIFRKNENDLFVTDEGNYIIDTNCMSFSNLEKLNQQLLQIPGVVETGLFLSSTNVVLMGRGSDVVKYKR